MYENKLPGAEPKLIDFGFACKVMKGHESIEGRYGTLSYMAPELLDTKEKGPYESSVDLWSIGVTVYTLLTGRKPFDHEDREVKKILIRQASPSFSNSRWSHHSPHAMDFVKCLMRGDPAMRLSASQALRHPWFSGLDLCVRRSLRHRTTPAKLTSVMVQSLQAFASAALFTRMTLEVVAFFTSPLHLREVRHVFAALDADFSGTLSRSEFVGALAQHREVPTKEAHAIFDGIDFNSSGQLELNEFCAALVWTNLSESDGMSAIKHSFQLLDKNRDGVLTLPDLQATFGKILNQEALVAAMRSFGTVYDRIDIHDFHQIVSDVAQPLWSRKSRHRSRGTRQCQLVPDLWGISRRSSRDLVPIYPPDVMSSCTSLQRSSSHSPIQIRMQFSLTTPKLRRFSSDP